MVALLASGSVSVAVVDVSKTWIFHFIVFEDREQTGGSACCAATLQDIWPSAMARRRSRICGIDENVVFTSLLYQI